MRNRPDLPDDVPIQLATRLPKTLYRAMKIDSAERNVSVQSWMQDALEVHLRRCTDSAAAENAPRKPPVTIRRPARAAG